jgi:hypothetical protein
MSVKYIVKSFALLGQHFFRLLCVSGAVQSVTQSHSTQQCILLTILQKGNFSKDHPKPPEDGPNGPKHVGTNV